MHKPLILAEALSADPAGLDWQPFRPGIEAAWLYRTDDNGPAAAYLRYQPGASAPRHQHVGYEHIFILTGSQRDENGLHPAGTLVINPPATAHSVTSDDGCLVLAVWERPVRFL